MASHGPGQLNADGPASAARAAAERAARDSYGRLVAYLAAHTRDIAGAEDALADAFASALAQWPTSGVPQKPEAWLLAVARRRQVDASRRRRTADAAREHVAMIEDERSGIAADEGFPDERLKLMFACAAPEIEPAMRAPLILQTLLGFDAATIGAAFLVSPATMGQRLVRAKSRIRQKAVPLRIPERSDMPGRLDAVLAAIYAAFAEGWSDAAGADARRTNLAGEAIWLGRVLSALLPSEPEVLGLLALMLFAEGRSAARRTAAGAYVPLAEQDVAAWNDELIDEAEALLLRASRFGAFGRYQIEAAVQSAHCARRRTRHVDWPAIRLLYEALAGICPSPVVAVNLAVAIAETDGPGAGLRHLDAVADDARLTDYQPYWAARADLLARCGDVPEARLAYERATGLQSDPATRAFLIARRERLGASLN